MKKDDFSDIPDMKETTTLSLAEDIRSWVKAEKERTIEEFAQKSGLSKRSVEYILQYKPGGDEPNWTRETLYGIMKVTGCKVYHTPEHRIK